MASLWNRSVCVGLLSASVFCASIGFLGQLARGDESDVREIPRAFAPFEYLVGKWNGNGRPKDKSAQQFRGWPETHSWAWIFEKGKPVGLAVTIEGGKFLTTGKLSYDLERKRYRLEGTEPKPAGGPIAFEGNVGTDGKRLVLDRVGADGKSGKMRVALWPNVSFIRYTMLLDRQEPGAVQFSPAFAIELGKEGESLAAGGTASEGPKCIVTGGAATMTLGYQGKTFPICCTGCRDEFNESPEKYIKKASLLNTQAGKAKSNQPKPAGVSRFDDAFAGDVSEPATEPKPMAGQGNQASPVSKNKIEKAESSSESSEGAAKDKSQTKTKKDAAKTAATKLANRAATLLRIGQNLEKDGKSGAALKNFRQIVKDFPGTPAAKTAAERIKALDKE
jgi:YHS domain-containing protein